MKEREVVFTGFNVIAFAVVTSGVKTLDDVVCKKATFFNLNTPTYRLYRSSNTGDHLNWIPVDSGSSNSVSVEGVHSLSEISVQRNHPSNNAFTGYCLINL